MRRAADAFVENQGVEGFSGLRLPVGEIGFDPSAGGQGQRPGAPQSFRGKSKADGALRVKRGEQLCEATVATADVKDGRMRRWGEDHFEQTGIARTFCVGEREIPVTSQMFAIAGGAGHSVAQTAGHIGETATQVSENFRGKASHGAKESSSLWRKKDTNSGERIALVQGGVASVWERQAARARVSAHAHAWSRYRSTRRMQHSGARSRRGFHHDQTGNSKMRGR